MLKFKTSCAVLAYLSSDLLNGVGLSLFRHFEVGLRVCDIVVKKFTFAISSPDEFLVISLCVTLPVTQLVGQERWTCEVAINRSWVQILLGAKLRNNLGQVVHTYVLLPPSSITCYRSRCSDALRLGR